MTKKAILILEGGGALGAYECGVYKALVPYLCKHQYEISIIGGASIGAINGGIIAKYSSTPDKGVSTLEEFWRELVTPSVPFFPFPGKYWDCWNGYLTGFILGNPKLYTFNPLAWLPGSSMMRLHLSMHSNNAMYRTLTTYLGDYKSSEEKGPLLIIKAIDVAEGQPVIFDSVHQNITIDSFVASASVPYLLPATPINNKLYWDGELWSNTILRDVLNTIQSQPSLNESIDEYLTIMVNLFGQYNEIPKSAMQIIHRIKHITLSDKASYDQRVCERVNSHIDFIQTLHEAAHNEPKSVLKELINNEYKKLLTDKRAKLNFINIERKALPYEYISQIYDFSEQHIESLIEQGYQDTLKQLM